MVAVATLVYAVITLGLLIEARAGRRVQEAETALARQANAELRIERDLSDLPFLSAQLDVGRTGEAFQLRISGHNWAQTPALDVTARLLVGPWDRLPPKESSLSILRETPQVYEVIPFGVPKGFVWTIHPSDLTEVTTVRLQYSGLLGATVLQTYELKRSDGSFDFVLLERRILPSMPGAEPIITFRLIR